MKSKAYLGIKLLLLLFILVVQVARISHLMARQRARKEGKTCVSYRPDDNLLDMLFRAPYAHTWKPRHYDYGHGLSGCICDNTPPEAKGEMLGSLGSYGCGL